jgi:hypothetical protein
MVIHAIISIYLNFVIEESVECDITIYHRVELGYVDPSVVIQDVKPHLNEELGWTRVHYGDIVWLSEVHLEHDRIVIHVFQDREF